MTRPKLSPAWFVDIKKTALLACTTAVLGVLIPVWNATQEMAALESNHPVMKLWIIPTVVLAWIFTATMPVFYFALYRNEGSLRFPKNLRQLSLVTALVLGVIVAMDLGGWIGSLGPYWTAMKALDWQIGATSVLTAARDSRTISQVSTVLAELSVFAYILLLIAFFRQPNTELFTEADVAVSRMLGFVTKVTLVAWGIWVAFNLIRVGLTPFAFFRIRSVALQIGKPPPQLASMMALATRTLLEQTCLFVAPYIVYNGSLRRD